MLKVGLFVLLGESIFMRLLVILLGCLAAELVLIVFVNSGFVVLMFGGLVVC